MTEISERIANLSPAKRQLLERRLAALQQASGQADMLKPRSSNEPAPLSFQQESLWLADQLNPGTISLNAPGRVLRLRGSLNVAALQQALDFMVERHETLRTVFRMIDGRPMQIIQPAGAYPLPLHDLSSLSEKDAWEEAMRLAEAVVRHRYDLSIDHMLQAALIRLGTDDFILVLGQHHISSDAWSGRIFVSELSISYNALAKGERIALTPIPVQYADYAIWQRAHFDPNRLDPNVAYWRNQLQNARPLTLDGDYARPMMLTADGSTVETIWSADLTASLRKWSRDNNLTPFNTLTATFLILLYRYTGENDILVGSLMGGRFPTETEEMVGYFIRPFPIRAHLDATASFTTWAQNVQDVIYDAISHEVPFARLMAETQPQRDINQDPLFHILINHLVSSDKGIHLDDLEVERIAGARDTVQWDVNLQIRELDDDIELSLRYRSDLYGAETMQRLLANYQILIANILQKPNQPITQSSIISEDERKKILTAWNDTAKSSPNREICLHQLIERHTACAPENVALIQGERRTTYAALNAHANVIAAELIANNIGRGSFVPVLLGRSIELVVAYLGILKAGAAFVPVDRHWPQKRIDAILEQIGTTALITDEKSDWSKTKPGMIPIIVDLAQLPTSDRNPDTEVLPADPCYLFYTSGSTGAPKGAINHHEGVANRFAAQTDLLGCHPGTKTLAITTPTFDPSIWQLLWPLTGGGYAVIPSSDEGIDFDEIIDLLAHDCITILNMSPSIMMLFLDHLAATRKEVADFPSLETIVLGGEKVTAGVAERVRNQFPSLSIINVYGPTEASISVAFYSIPEQNTDLVPIGKPMPNVFLVVVDDDLNLQPFGVAGELLIGGRAVGLGYLSDEQATRTAFIPNPFPELACETLYRTGDLARWRADGNLEFLGRKDRQFKIMGIRVEPGEIESTLNEHPEIRNAVVLLDDPRQHLPRIIAYLVAKTPAQPPGDDELRNFLAARLPVHLIPHVFAFIDHIPVLASGKTDLRRLSSIEVGINTPRDFVPPTTDTEIVIAAIWCDLLGVESIGVHDNFFELGGHSLIAAQLVHRLRQTLAPDLPLRTLFEHPTIAGLAAAVNGKQLPVGSQQLADTILHPQSADQNPKSPLPNTQSLLPLQTHGSLPPFFFLPGGGGSEDEYLIYANLLNRLGPDQPVYGFIARGLNDEAEPHNSVVVMAADYVDELRTVQPHGPYFLGGECIGGKVALEMARLLAAQGEEMGLLVLMNTFVRGRADERSLDERMLAAPGVRQIRRRWRELRRLPADQRWARLRQMAANTASVALPRTDEQREAREERTIRLGYGAVLGGFMPEPYPGDMALLATTDVVARLAPLWNSLVMGRLDVITLPGEHANYLGAGVETSAQALARQLSHSEQSAHANS